MTESYQGIPNFQEWYAQRKEGQILTDFSEVKLDEVHDFIYGCKEIQAKLNGVRADTVFFPERGAAPISWVLDELYNGAPYLSVHLPIGTGVERTNNRWAGFTDNEKEVIVGVEVKKLLESGHVVNKPALIDEVQTGGTMSFIAPTLFSALASTFLCDTLNVIAAKDDRNRKQPIRAKKLKQMMAQRFPHLPTSLTLLSLFYIDRVNMLNIIVKDDLTVVPNQRAESIFRLLSHVAVSESVDPHREAELFELATSSIQDQKELDQFGSWIEQIRESRHG